MSKEAQVNLLHTLKTLVTEIVDARLAATKHPKGDEEDQSVTNRKKREQEEEIQEEPVENNKKKRVRAPPVAGPGWACKGNPYTNVDCSGATAKHLEADYPTAFRTEDGTRQLRDTCKACKKDIEKSRKQQKKLEAQEEVE